MAAPHSESYGWQAIRLRSVPRKRLIRWRPPPRAPATVEADLRRRPGMRWTRSQPDVAGVDRRRPPHRVGRACISLRQRQSAPHFLLQVAGHDEIGDLAGPSRSGIHGLTRGRIYKGSFLERETRMRNIGSRSFDEQASSIEPISAGTKHRTVSRVPEQITTGIGQPRRIDSEQREEGRREIGLAGGDRH
jgi:hypothetical protein